MGVFYASREEGMQSLDVRASAYESSRIDRALDSASRDVESLTCRKFYPWTGTRYFDFPNAQMARAGRLWLDENELASVSSFVSGGVTIPPAGYLLEPVNSGPPYRSININRGTSYTLASGPLTQQQSLAITGVFCGCPLTESDAGTLASAVSTTSATTITVTGANIGVGRILRIDTERMIVTDKTYITSTQNVTVTANLNAQSLAVSDGTVFRPREEIIVESERMLVLEIIGNTLTVKRAYAGTSLAAHTAVPIFYARQLTVSRGQLGTTAATHLINAPIVRHVIPGPIEQLTLAYMLHRYLGEETGYARTIGNADNARNAMIAVSLAELEERVLRGYGRRIRFEAV